MPWQPGKSAVKGARVICYALLFQAVDAVALYLMDSTRVGELLQHAGIGPEVAPAAAMLVTFGARFAHDWLAHRERGDPEAP